MHLGTYSNKNRTMYRRVARILRGGGGEGAFWF